MRPLKIRLEGFSAYRKPVELDLSGIEFFSLSGATGSGKSSLVDAMVFALYGRVPRLGARAVAPAITAGADVARVAFDFEVGGTAYTAVRRAQRNKSGGASVKEARLQEGEKVIADGASEVTRAVEELLRLRFEDFTRTVVLPQGEFARFLTADKAERQALLRNLLGLEVYANVRSLAKTRESVARDRVEVARAQVKALDVPDDEDVAAARGRLSVLEQLADVVVEREQELSGLEAKRVTAERQVETLEDALERLASIEPPPRLDELDGLARTAKEAVDQADQHLEKVKATTAHLDTQISELLAPDAIRNIREAWGRLGETERSLDSFDEREARASVEGAEASLAEARVLLDNADSELASARVAHSAHALSATLVVGEPCPVCDQDVSAIPDDSALGELADLEAAKQAAATATETAAVAAESSRLALATLETTRAGVESRRKELIEELASSPSIDDLVVIEASHGRLAAELETARADMTRSESDRKSAQRELEDLSEAVRTVARDFMAARQQVADLDPPLPASDDAIVQWKELEVWTATKLSDMEKGKAAAKEAASTASVEFAEALDALQVELESAAVPQAQPYAVEVAREAQVAKTAVMSAEKAAGEQKRLEALISSSSDEAAVAGALANHLKADGFERWLMSAAIADLVAGANDRLNELSSGGYSLQSDESGAFSIVDHHNADEIRSVATLSGGETFLVSLALALSLAETLAARGGADLDAIIIDEGFGTLDNESLDTVASVLEDLSGGLMVGVITHVKELASRAPVRYEVTREPTGSKVELVS